MFAHGIAAFLGMFDFIYCVPNAWLSVPFTFLGIVAEGGSSASFIRRSESRKFFCSLSFVGSCIMANRICEVGVAKANEVLLWGKKVSAQELLQSGFVK
jgi:Delta3-Delta2-enoyl-CoA isomerase